MLYIREIRLTAVYIVHIFRNSDAQPTNEELETYREVQCVLQDAKQILHELQQYKGAGNEIREVKNKLCFAIRLVQYFFNFGLSF